MEDSEIPVEEGFAEETLAPEPTDSPEVASKDDSPTPEVDSELTEWATKRGYSEDDLKDVKLSKAVKMAYDNQKAFGKAKAQPQEESEDEDTDIDRWVEEILGETSKPQPTQTATEGINFENMSPQEKQAFDFLKQEATKAAQQAVEPALRAARKQEMTAQYNKLAKEFGNDFVKSSKEILIKMRDNPGISMSDATRSILMDKLLKKKSDEGIQKGKAIHKEELADKVETVKKTATKTLSEEWKELTLAEQEKILFDLQNKG